MSKPNRHTSFGTARVKALSFLFAALLLLGMGKVFGQPVFSDPDGATLAYQAHTQACKGALFSVPSGPESPPVFSSPGITGNIPPLFSRQLLPSALRGQVKQAFVSLPKVKRCILFSCLKMGGPPPLLT